MSLESLTIIRILTPVSSCIEQGVLWTGIIKSKVNQCKALLSTRKCQRVVMMCDSGVACVDVENRFESARFDTTGGWHSEFSCTLELVRGQKSHVKTVIFVFSKSGGKNASFVFRL